VGEWGVSSPQQVDTPDDGDEPGRSGDAQAHHPTGSRVVHKLGERSQSTAATSTAALVSAGFLLVALLAPRATPWLTAFEALAAAVTLVMVFALQHTQARQQAALQRKLDEILRALPGADNRLMHLESASEQELAALDEQHSRVRRKARSGPLDAEHLRERSADDA
jgi:low affinity Fe/Cu permease